MTEKQIFASSKVKEANIKEANNYYLLLLQLNK
jgi:hypothetical protein